MTDSNNTKLCNKCKEIKLKSEFSPDKRSTDGCQPSCKKCINKIRKEKYHTNIEKYQERQREYYKNNKERVLATNNKSRLKNRDKVLKQKKEYYEKVKQNPEWQQKEKQKRELKKDKKRLYDIEYRKNNYEKCLNKAIKWRKENPEKRKTILINYSAKRRSKEKEGDSFKKINQWLTSQVKICYWCGLDCKDNYHVDHYVPLAKGGKHITSNLVIACAKCNLTKNAKDPYDFAKEKGRLF